MEFGSTALSKLKLRVCLIPGLSYGNDHGSAAMVLVPGTATVLPPIGLVQADIVCV